MAGKGGIDTVELRVRDLGRAEDFYTGALGLQRIQDEPLTLGAGGRPLVVLRHAEAAAPAPPGSTGLFHVAIRLPGRAELARALRRVAAAAVPLRGASHH